MNPQLVDTGKVYSIKPEDRKGDFTFTRSSAATRVDADGLVEKETQNLFLQSNTFNTTWGSTRTNEVSGYSGYDGTSDAWKIIGTDGAEGVRDHYLRQSYSVTGVVTFSAYFKAAEKNWVRILFANSPNPRADFDLNNGSVHNIAGDAIDAEIISVGNGWYRCSLTANLTASSLIQIYVAEGSGVTAWTGDDTSGVYIQDAQLEQGLVARNYIETTTAAVEGGITDNVPRLDYTDSSCPALLLEPQRTNIIESSEYFQDDYWANLGIHEFQTNTTDATSPTEDYSATKIVADTNSSSNHNVYGDVSLSSGTQYAVSIFAKAGEYDYLFIRGLGLGASGGARFNISTGVVEGVAGYDSATIEDYGNGWYRCIAVGTSAGTTAPYYHMSPTSDFTPFAGNNSDGIYIYGAQCEAGSYATSYIPTYGTSVTRNADRAQILNTTTDVLSQTAFTLFFEADLTSDTTNNFKDIVAFRGASKELRFETRTDNSVRVQSNMITSGDSWNSATIGDTDNKKFAMTFTTSQVRLYADGSLVSTYNGAYSSDLVHILFINSTSLGVETKTSFKQYILFATALSNQEAIALTTI